MNKIYIVRYILPANSIKEAVKKAKASEPDDVYVSDETYKILSSPNEYGNKT